MKPYKRTVFFLLAALLAGLLVAASVTGEWLLSAVAIGFMFGFAMQRANFCSASILSSVVLDKDRRGVTGLGLAVFAAMIGFAVMTLLGWMTPNPKPMKLLPAIAGGTIFGCGIVLAGGCVSGSLFKAGEGRLTSILALVGIGIGTNLAGPGLLGPARKALISATAGVKVPAGIDRAAGISFGTLALAVGIAGFLALMILALRRKPAHPKGPLLDRLVSSGWSYAAVGIFIGVLGWVSYLSSSACGRDYPLGVTHGVMALFSALTGGQTGIVWWLLLLCLAIVAGSAASAWLRGTLALRSAEASTLLIALVGGVLVGAGAVTGSGCFVGNFLSGFALLSLHSLLFGVFAVLAAWATAILYLRGLK
jgi:uncharacterized membrane protein YedE/YeeE